MKYVWTKLQSHKKNILKCKQYIIIKLTYVLNKQKTESLIISTIGIIDNNNRNLNKSRHKC